MPTGPVKSGAARSTSAAAVSIASLVSFAASAAAAPRRRSRSAAATSSALGTGAPSNCPLWDPRRALFTVAATAPRPSTEKTQCSSLPAARQPSAVAPPVHAAQTADRKFPASIRFPTPSPRSASAASQNAARSSDEGFWILSGCFLFPFSVAPFAPAFDLVPLASFSISSRPLAKHDRKPRFARIVVAATTSSSTYESSSRCVPTHAARESSEGRSAATSCAAARGDSSWNAGPASTAADANRRNRPVAAASKSASGSAKSSSTSRGPGKKRPVPSRSDNFAAAHDALATTRC